MNQDRFVEAIQALSHRCNYELTAFDFELYGREAEKMGWDKAVAAVTAMYKETPQNGKFPSLNELAERANPAGLSDEDLAKETAFLIFEAMRTCGYTMPEKAKEKIGSLGWKVVEMSGGWVVFCQSVTDEDMVPTVRAQCRDLALAILRKAKNGMSGPPQLPAAEDSLATKLIGDLSKDVDRTKKSKDPLDSE